MEVEGIIKLLRYERPALHNNINGYIVNGVYKGIDLCSVIDREKETSTRDKLDNSLVIGFFINNGFVGQAGVTASSGLV